MGEPVGVDACSVDPDAVITARVETSRDIRLLAGGLTALPVGVAGPTAAVALGVAFAIVVPFGSGLFLFPPVGLALWLRSSVATWSQRRGRRLLINGWTTPNAVSV